MNLILENGSGSERYRYLETINSYLHSRTANSIPNRYFPGTSRTYFNSPYFSLKFVFPEILHVCNSVQHFSETLGLIVDCAIARSPKFHFFNQPLLAQFLSDCLDFFGITKYIEPSSRFSNLFLITLVIKVRKS